MLCVFYHIKKKHEITLLTKQGPREGVTRGLPAKILGWYPAQSRGGLHGPATWAAIQGP